MNKSLLSFLFLIYFPTAAASDGDYRVLKSISVDHYSAELIVKEGGHLIGQPYQVELRVNCHDSNESDSTSWDIKDSFSVCDLDPESSIINNQNTAVAIKTKMADMKSYNDAISNGELHPEMKCQKKTQIKKISLRNLCGHNHP